VTVNRIAHCSALVALLLAATATPASSRDPETPAHPDRIQVPISAWQPPDPKTLRHTFPRGLHAYFLPDRAAAVVNVRFFVARGWLHDKPDQTGCLALTLQSMLRGGTSMWSPLELGKQMGLLGIELRVAVHPAFGEIDASFPPENTRKALFLIAELLLAPTFDSGAIEREKLRLKNRLQRLSQDAHQMAKNHFIAMTFGLPPLCSDPNILKALDRKTLKTCHNLAFRSTKMVIALSGDFDLLTVKDILAYKYDVTDKKITPTDLPGTTPKTAVHFFPSSNGAAVVLGGRTVPMLSPDYPAYDLLGALLDEPPLVRTVGAEGLRFDRTPRLGLQPVAQIPGTLSLTYACRSREIPATLARVFAKLRSLVAEGTPQADLARARAVVLARVHHLFRSPLAISSTFARLDIQGLPPTFWSKYIRGLRAVDTNTLRRCAASLQNKNSLLITVVGDPQAVADGEIESGQPLSNFGNLHRHK